MDSIESFRRIDDTVTDLTAAYTRAKLSQGLPRRSDVGRRDGYGILKRELQKKTRHKPLRQLAAEMGDALTQLAPCMLMSPLSIAQYLPPDQALFNLVIFDEASQITPWDAVGSIARGQQVVIAGDPRQMPPTTFFQRGVADHEFDSDAEADLESILDECLAVGIPQHSLSWHYRSRHESLIAFSNHRYYGGGLVTFPAAVTKESAVTWKRVQGVYAKGKGRTNSIEAKEVVQEAVRRLTDPGFVASGQSLGIITLNSEQQTMIEDLLDEARKSHRRIERFFSDDLSEPVVVKNLETVQGDERDIILISIGYGPDTEGAQTMSMNFGPLNRDGGHRRLNVALTRARHEMVIFTSFSPSMIDQNRTGAKAVHDLKLFLEFADRGPRALAEAVSGSLGGHESPFETAVAERLQRRGWNLVPQVGVSRFRIDLGVVHPDHPGEFLAGIECDGASYHSSPTARDRDKIRAKVLSGLGWKLLRVWSTDWFIDPETQEIRLHEQLVDLLKADKERREAEEATVKSQDQTNEVALPDPSTPPESRPLTPEDQSGQEPLGGNQRDRPDGRKLVARMPSPHATPPETVVYRDSEFSDFRGDINPDAFHDEAYTSLLREMILEVAQTEAPVSDQLMVQRIARAHGFKRSGRLIRERILELAGESLEVRQDPDGGLFLWLPDQEPELYRTVRRPADGASSRNIDQIPPEEIRAAGELVSGEDPVMEVARLFGIARLSAAARGYIERSLAADDEAEAETSG